jgi:diacylglycerol kinase family enzyme
MIGIILNPRSGYVSRHGVDHVCSLIRQTLPKARVHILQKHDDVAARCAALVEAGVRCIAAAGGDGTVNSVAHNLVGTATPLGVIPVGTLNHFARDVGVGRNVEAALRILAHGYAMPVDVATVNDHVFVNNSSIGLYPRMVEIRERYEKRLGKWPALIEATLLIVREAQPSVVQITDGDNRLTVRTELIFVGNNQYEVDLLHLGKRTRIDAGELCCFILEVPGRVSLWRHIFRYLRDKQPKRHFLRSLEATELAVIPRSRGRVEVAADGEVFHLTAPLRYRVLSRALQVVVPEPPPLGSRGERDQERQLRRTPSPAAR